MSNKPQRLAKHHDPDFLSVFNATSKRLASSRVGFLMSVDELYTLWQGIRRVPNIEANQPDNRQDLAMVEAGVFQGASACFIAEAMKHHRVKSRLVLCDTFAGMPDELIGPNDNWQRGGHKACSVEGVGRLFHGLPDPLFLKGRIPDSFETYTGPLYFSFANLDLDLYASTLGALRFVWRYMLPNAWLVSHNYNDKGSVKTAGVRKAFEEFFGHIATSEFTQVEISDTQILVVKTTMDRCM